MRPLRPALLAAPALLGVLALTGCQSSAPDTAADPAPTTTVAATASETAADHSPPDADSWPADVELPAYDAHYTSVVLSTGTSAELAASVDAAGAHGYHAVVSDLGCAGVSDAVDLPADALVSSVVFADPAAAATFASSWTDEGHDLVGSVDDVTVGCLD